MKVCISKSADIEKCVTFHRICENVSTLQNIQIDVQIKKYSSPVASSE